MDKGEAIASLQRGEIGGLEMLVRTYQLRALHTAYLITRDRPLAEDIVQAAFLRAYERIYQFDARRPFGPWFLRSVVNDAIKAASRRERWLSLDHAIEREEAALAQLVADPNPGPEALAENAEIRRAIDDAFGGLSPSQRAIIVLRYYHGLPEAEIARRMGCPQGTIKWRLHVLRQRLREVLGIFRPNPVRDMEMRQTVLVDPDPGTESGPTVVGGKR